MTAVTTAPSLGTLRPPAPRGRLAAGASLVAFAAVLVAGETWAKWWPYAGKIADVSANHVYPGHSILGAAGAPGAAPSWSHAWHFTVVYGRSVWVALVAALLIGAGVQALLPPGTFRRAFGPGGVRGALAGTLAALPSFMCTCCAAPVTNSLRRSGASRSSALAYWLANPLLNPAVLVFLALVLPWQFVVTRVLVGSVLVAGASLLVPRLGPDRLVPVGAGPARRLRRLPLVPPDPAPTDGLAVSRFLRALARLAVVLVPEYLVVVLGVGALRGWLLPLGHSASSWGFAAVLIAAAAGTVLVIPTGAEIPVMAALVAAGFTSGVEGAVLIALPAVSLPSMVMVGRDLSWRVVGAVAAGVVVCALLGAALLSVLL